MRCVNAWFQYVEATTPVYHARDAALERVGIDPMSHLDRDELRDILHARSETVYVQIGAFGVSSLKLHNLVYGVSFGVIIGLIGHEVPVLATHAVILGFLLFCVGLRIKFPKRDDGDEQIATVFDVRVKRNHWTIAVLEIWEKPAYFMLPLVVTYVAVVSPVIANGF